MMMGNSIRFGALVIGLALFGAGAAQAGVDGREVNQRSRIRAGVQDGSLTRPEARRLVRQQSHIERVEQRTHAGHHGLAPYRGLAHRLGQAGEVALTEAGQVRRRGRAPGPLESLLDQVPVGTAGHRHAGKRVGHAEQLLESAPHRALAGAAPAAAAEVAPGVAPATATSE